MITKLIFLILILFKNQNYYLVNGEEQSSLIFENTKRIPIDRRLSNLNNENNLNDENNSNNENVNLLLDLPKIINLPKDDSIIVQKTIEDPKNTTLAISKIGEKRKLKLKKNKDKKTINSKPKPDSSPINEKESQLFETEGTRYSSDDFVDSKIPDELNEFDEIGESKLGIANTPQLNSDSPSIYLTTPATNSLNERASMNSFSFVTDDKPNNQFKSEKDNFDPKAQIPFEYIDNSNATMIDKEKDNENKNAIENLKIDNSQPENSSPIENYQTKSYPEINYESLKSFEPNNDLNYTTTLSPTNTESTIILPENSNNQEVVISTNEPTSQSDYIEEAKNLSTKIGYQETVSNGLSQEEERNEINKINDIAYSSKLNSKDDTNEPKEFLHKSIYELHKEKVKQQEEQMKEYQLQKIHKIEEQAQKERIQSERIQFEKTQTKNKETEKKVDTPLIEQKVSNSVATIKISNPSPNVIKAKTIKPFPSMDLLRRNCAIKINGFSSFGICRRTCGPKEIGIRTELKSSCSNQLSCNDFFESCCVPNLSEFDTCNVDLFVQNEILARVEKSLNLPQNSLIKLSQLQPAFIESIVNYGPFFLQNNLNKNQLTNLENANDKFANNNLNVSITSVNDQMSNLTKKELANKLFELKSLGTKSDNRKSFIDSNKINVKLGKFTQFKTILNAPTKSNRFETRKINPTLRKILRKVENPRPFVKNIYHIHDGNDKYNYNRNYNRGYNYNLF